MKIERLLGNEYESENTVYKNGVRVLSEGEQFILIGISQDGTAKILINATPGKVPLPHISFSFKD